MTPSLKTLTKHQTLDPLCEKYQAKKHNGKVVVQGRFEQLFEAQLGDDKTIDSTSIEQDQGSSMKLTDVELVSANESESSTINQFNTDSAFKVLVPVSEYSQYMRCHRPT